MPLGLLSPVRKKIYGNLPLRAFVVTRLHESEIKERVFLKTKNSEWDITRSHSMICLDPFCVAIWLSPENTHSALNEVMIKFKKGDKLLSKLRLTLLDKIPDTKSCLLLYRVKRSGCYQLNFFSRFLTLYRFLKNGTSTYGQRKTIAALYSYPRKIISVSYKEKDYCNIFPMDIQGYIPESGLYILGLRTTNLTLDKIIANKKVLIADTHKADIKVIYDLGKHGSSAPPPVESLPFSITDSEVFNFPVPDYSSSYKEIEIIHHRKLGYHMLLVGKVINQKETIQDPALLYHVHLMQFVNSGYGDNGNHIVF